MITGKLLQIGHRRQAVHLLSIAMHLLFCFVLFVCCWFLLCFFFSFLLSAGSIQVHSNGFEFRVGHVLKGIGFLLVVNAQTVPDLAHQKETFTLWCS